jgi:HAD superfamily hydrolase (TIGR01509 family)
MENSNLIKNRSHFEDNLLRNIKVIIYDCDGVLIDSKLALEAFYNKILNHFDMPPTTKYNIDAVYAKTTKEAISYLFQSTPWIDEAIAYNKIINTEELLHLIKPEPNINETLEQLRPRHLTAVATNRGRSLSIVLKHFGLEQHFDFIISCVTVPAPKPHPGCIQKILDYFEVRPDQSIYIGDSEVDRLFSDGAGVPFIAYQNPEIEALYCIQNHLDLLDLLKIKVR